MEDTSKLIKTIFADFIEILIIGIAVFALGWIFLAEPLEVTGESMEPTLHDKEQIIVEKLSMNFGELERGDIVVFNSPENPDILIIKRLIGLPGDTVMLEDGKVYLNGNMLEETYIRNGTETKGKTKLKEGVEAKIPNDTVFVLGDNRTNSTDSREFGPVKTEDVIGRAFMVYYPFDSFRKVSRIAEALYIAR